MDCGAKGRKSLDLGFLRFTYWARAGMPKPSERFVAGEGAGKLKHRFSIRASFGVFPLRLPPTNKAAGAIHSSEVLLTRSAIRTMLSSRLGRVLAPQSISRTCARPFAARSFAGDSSSSDSEAQLAEERLDEERVGQEGACLQAAPHAHSHAVTVQPP